MTWTWIVVTLLVGYIVYQLVGHRGRGIEGFTLAKRADIGPSIGEEPGYERDLRYTATFADIQGLGVATDFCRAVVREGDPQTLHIAVALGLRDGMNTMEYTSRTVGDGFRMSRDDYYSEGRYCRILRDEETGEWAVSCAVAGRTGFKAAEEPEDDPPAAIRTLLRAYEGALSWYRWRDDGVEYVTGASAMEVRGPNGGVNGGPKVPTLLNPLLTRGLELNRDRSKAPLDFYRWHHKHINGRRIRAMSCWIWWDAFERGAKIVDCGNGFGASRRDRFWLGIEGGGQPLAPVPVVVGPVKEVRPATLLAVGQLTEPSRAVQGTVEHVGDTGTTGTYVFEIWDDKQRVMRLESPMAAAHTDRWQHLVVTTTDDTAFWPTWQMWIDGECVATRTDGRMSSALEFTVNSVGRGVRGCLQDFRVYSRALTPDDVAATRAWAQPTLHPSP